jgi:two-component system, NarL family, response regulator NreC
MSFTDARPLSEYPRRPRVLLADDDASVRTAVSRLLSPSCDVVGCVADIATLFDAAAELRPDVVVLDFSLPGGLNGIEVCRRLKKMRPESGVVAFTAHDDAELSRRALEAGASSYVWKLQAATDLLVAIQAAAAGLTTRS